MSTGVHEIRLASGVIAIVQRQGVFLTSSDGGSDFFFHFPEPISDGSLILNATVANSGCFAALVVKNAPDSATGCLFVYVLCNGTAALAANVTIPIFVDAKFTFDESRLVALTDRGEFFFYGICPLQLKQMTPFRSARVPCKFSLIQSFDATDSRMIVQVQYGDDKCDYFEHGDPYGTSNRPWNRVEGVAPLFKLAGPQDEPATAVERAEQEEPASNEKELKMSEVLEKLEKRAHELYEWQANLDKWGEDLQKRSTAVLKRARENEKRQQKIRERLQGLVGQMQGLLNSIDVQESKGPIESMWRTFSAARGDLDQHVKPEPSGWLSELLDEDLIQQLRTLRLGERVEMLERAKDGLKK